jgi:hypothetical protein
MIKLSGWWSFSGFISIIKTHFKNISYHWLFYIFDGNNKFGKTNKQRKINKIVNIIFKDKYKRRQSNYFIKEN